MDTDRLAALVRTVSQTQSRRGISRALTSLGLGAVLSPMLGHADVDAKKKKKKKKVKSGPPGPAGPQGPAGSATCPAGTTFYGSAGCVEDSARTAAAFVDASAACHAARRRLLTGAELIAYAHEPGVTIGGPSGGLEWTGDIVPGSSGQTLALAVTDASNISFSPLTGVSLAFRCSTLPAI